MGGPAPAGEHVVVVVSHRPKPDGWHPEASYYLLDDVAAAIAKANELSGERMVAVAAGDVGGQALALGLVDEGGLPARVTSSSMSVRPSGRAVRV